MEPDGLALSANADAAAATELVARVQAGDTAAFRQLFDAYRGLVYRIARRLVGDADEAADLTQEIFLVVFRRIRTLRECACLRAWICRITVTRAHNRLRALRRRQARAHVSLAASGEGPAIELRARSADPEQALLSKESAAALSRALGRLPFAYRAAVIMRDVEGLSYEEIALSLGVPPGTVKSRIARGREELRRALQEGS